jgi:hypothetical protein
MGPTFILIGAGRSGTTSIHAYLAQHPEVFVPEKSPNHFVAADPIPEWEGPSLRAMARQWVADPAAYERLFEDAGSAKARGDVSPVYLQSVNAPSRIAARYAGVRIVAILRDPVERAHAHYQGRRRDGLDRRESFEQVVNEELSRPLPEVVAFGSHLGCGRYHHFLKPYYDLFSRDRIRIYLYEDLQQDAAALMADLQAFIGVDRAFRADLSHRGGQTGEIRNPLARLIWTRSVAVRTALRPWLPRGFRDRAAPIVMRDLHRPSLDPAMRERLRPLFREDVRRLQELIGRDLSHWL